MVKSCARFTHFDRGRIVGKAEEGASAKKIRQTVRKKDATHGTVRAINAISAKARADPKWKGRDSAAGGRPKKLSPHEVAKLKKLMHEEVGVSRVTVAYCKKRLPFLRRVSKECGVTPPLKGGRPWTVAISAVPAQCPPSARHSARLSARLFFVGICVDACKDGKHALRVCFSFKHGTMQNVRKK